MLDQLIDQLHAAQAQRSALLASIKAEFDREIFALRQELAEVQHKLKMLRVLDELAKWQPTYTTPRSTKFA